MTDVVASIVKDIRAAESAGEKIIAIRPNGKIVFESGSNGEILGEVAGTAEEFVYFVTDGEFIKIGYSINWPVRIAQIQAYNPRELTVLAVFRGTMAYEWGLHQRFAQHRIRSGNEWFRDCQEIRDFIANAPASEVVFKAGPA